MTDTFKLTAPHPGETVLLISSKNYSSWSLRGYLLLHLSGLDFREQVADPEDPTVRDELLMRTSSIRLPCLLHDGVSVWDTLAIAEYLNEFCPEAAMLPEDRLARAVCRSISGEMHSGFSALRSSLPMNLRSRRRNFTVWSSARADIERVTEIFRQCLETWKGPWLFGARPSIADAMYAPVATRFLTYGVTIDSLSQAWCDHVLAWAPMRAWMAQAEVEPEMIDELEVDMDF